MTLDDAALISVNDTTTVHETFEQEVLVVNLDTGTYYSLTGSAAQIWRCVLADMRFDDMLKHLGSAYDVSPKTLTDTVKAFISELVTENIALISQNGSQRSAPPPPIQVDEPYSPPQLQRFTDMQELLLLDPVHDVDEAGWPVAKPDHSV